MGVLKNDVGRPSKKTKIIRGILKLIGILIIVAAGLYIGYIIGNSQNKEEEKTDKKKTEVKENKENEVKELDVNDEQIVSLFNNFNGFSNYEDIMFDVYSDGRSSYETTTLFNYFYLNDSLDNNDISDQVKFGVSFYDLYLKDNQDFNIYENNTKYSLDDINNKSVELFGSEIKVEDILYSNNYVKIGVAGAVFKYDNDSKSFSIVDGGIGGYEASYRTKIIKAEEINDKIEITSKVIFVYQTVNENGNNTIKLFKNSTANYNNGYLGLSNEIDDLGETNELDENIIDNYIGKADSYKWTFDKNEDGNYVFEKVEKID